MDRQRQNPGNANVNQQASALLLQAATQDITLERPDMEQKRQQRLDRTRATMKAVNPHITDEVMPKEDRLTGEEKAAVRIQAQYRGHMGRKKYTQLLYQQFEKEEAMRLQKTMEQVEEGELLVENHRLQVQFDDNTTTRRNKSRQYITHVVTIQRAWRAYKRRRQQTGSCRANNNMSPQALSEGEDVSETDSSNGAQAMSVSTSGDSSEKNLEADQEQSDSDGGNADAAYFNLPGVTSAVSLLARKHVIEPDPDSVASDYSEMAGPIKEHLANVQIIQREDLQIGNTMFANQFTVQQKITRGVDETEEEFSKRLRKINYLSLAQEFAELKKIDSTASPFDLHNKSQGRELDDSSPVSDISSETDSERHSTLTTPMETQKGFAPDLIMQSGDQADLKRRMQEVAVSAESNKTIPVEPSCGNPNPKSQQLDSVDGLSASKLTNPLTLDGKHEKKAGSPARKNHPGSSTIPSSSPSKNAQLCRSMSEGTKSANVLEKGSQDSTIPESGKNKSESADDLHDFDVYNIETTLPQMDWAMLEHQLQMAAEEEKEKKKSRHNDREEIRRRLAMGTDEDYYGGERAYKKPNLQTRLQGGMNLQICFVNESTLDSDLGNVGKVAAPGEADSTNANLPAEPEATPATVPAPDTANGAGSKTSAARSKPPKTKAEKAPEPPGDEDFHSRQARLQAEARMALAQVRPMAHMQLEVEKQMRKKSPIAEIVGIPGIGDGKKTRFQTAMLHDMNLAQLQVVVNDLHSQIESLNEDLVHLLIDRDDLHMEQDSMLVDIEDHTRRAQEFSKPKAQSKPKKKDKERERKK